MQLSLALLGPYYAALGDELVASRAKKIEALLTYLCLEARQPLPRYVLSNLLFPDSAEEMARTNLRQLFTRLRKLLHNNHATPPFVIVTRRTVQFNSESAYSLDVDQFLAKRRGCQRHEDKVDGRCSDCIEQLSEAIELYRGPFLNGFYLPDNNEFEAWLYQKRDAFQKIYLELLTTVTTYHEQIGNYALADRYVQRQLAVEPWQESYYQQRMRLLMRQGKRTEALTLYKRCRAALLEELGVEPTRATHALVDRIREASDARPNNLPALHHRPFVGRISILNQLKRRLALPEQRLLTLVGQGGIGKTEIALQAASAAVNDHLGPFTDGVFWVTLDASNPSAPFLSAEGLATAMAHALQLPLSGSLPPQRQLIAKVRQAECLFIIDNGEFLGPAAKQFLSNLLHHTNSVKLLVTSRARLTLSHEWSLNVSGLQHPAGTRFVGSMLSEPLIAANQYEAVEMFVQRAHRGDSGFVWGALPSTEQLAIVRITQLTEGMPLSLELAAAWVHVLSCQTLAEEIEQTIDILAQTESDLPERHRSVRAVFEHSWQMLSEREQVLLAHLSIFCGSFNAHAAQQIVGTRPHQFASLINKSLLQSVDSAHGKRYVIHGLLRQFAQNKLQQAQQQTIAARHADYYGVFVHQRHDALSDALESPVFSEIQLELDNIRAGWGWAAEQSLIPLLEQYVYTLQKFYSFRGWYFEGQTLFEPVLALKTHYRTLTEIPADHARFFSFLLSSFAGFKYECGQVAEAETLIHESIQLSRMTEEPQELVRSHKRLVQLCVLRGDHKQAKNLLTFIHTIAKESKLDDEMVNIMMFEGAVYRDQGQYQLAHQAFEMCLEHSRNMAYQWGEIHALRLLGEATVNLGNITLAHHYMEQCYTLVQQGEYAIGEALLMVVWGDVWQTQGNTNKAEQAYERGLTLFKTYQHTRGEAVALEKLGRLMVAKQQVTQAQRHYQKAFQLAVLLQNTSLILQIIFSIAVLALQNPLQQPKRSQSLKLLSLIYHHTSSTQRLKQRLETMLEQLSIRPNQLPAVYYTLSDIEKIVTMLLGEPHLVTSS